MRVPSAVFNVAAAGLTAIAVAACGGGGNDGSTGSVQRGFVSTNLVSNVRAANNPFSGANVDPNLVNAWGIAFNPQGFVWVADNSTSTATLYDGNGVPQPLVVSIPAGRAGNANPTGIVFNGSQGFSVSQGATTAPSAFLFAGEAGTISGWSPTVNMTNAIRVIDASARGSVFKGLAIASVAGAPRLYATDFHNNTVAVWDETFARIDVAGAFTDENLPAGFAPFGIQAIGDQIYVSYAKQDAQAHDQIDGAGGGAVDVFDTSGNLVKRLIPVGGKLNAPWGMTVAPADFGPLSNSLLVGNFGDGKINAFDVTTGAPLSTLSDANGSPIVIDGLWGLAFGNGLDAQPTQALFFSGGPAAESNGVYGRIEFR